MVEIGLADVARTELDRQRVARAPGERPEQQPRACGDQPARLRRVEMRPLHREVEIDVGLRQAPDPGHLVQHRARERGAAPADVEEKDQPRRRRDRPRQPVERRERHHQRPPRLVELRQVDEHRPGKVEIGPDVHEERRPRRAVEAIGRPPPLLDDDPAGDRPPGAELEIAEPRRAELHRLGPPDDRMKRRVQPRPQGSAQAFTPGTRTKPIRIPYGFHTRSGPPNSLTPPPRGSSPPAGTSTSGSGRPRRCPPG